MSNAGLANIYMQCRSIKHLLDAGGVYGDIGGVAGVAGGDRVNEMASVGADFRTNC